jgi:hypothetical protein
LWLQVRPGGGTTEGATDAEGEGVEEAVVETEAAAEAEADVGVAEAAGVPLGVAADALPDV